MIQLSDKCSMFAVSTDQADRTYPIGKRLFLCLDGSLYPKDIRLSIPYMAILTYCMSCLLGRRWEETAFLVSVHFNFIHSMTKQNEICNAANNSNCTATSAHETCNLSSLSGNPYRDLALYGLDLHGCKINFLKTSNENGHSVTGVFNISGRYHTAGANSYAELIASIVQIRMERKRYVNACRQAKRERYKMNRMKRLSA